MLVRLFEIHLLIIHDTLSSMRFFLSTLVNHAVLLATASLLLGQQPGIAAFSPQSAARKFKSNSRQQQQKRPSSVILARTSTILFVSTAPQRSSNNMTSSSSTTTPTPKYPTLRGTTVDARKIVKTGAARQHLKAIRLSHILFETRDLADASLHRLRSSEISFADLATQISACKETRDKGGALGWINVVPITSKSSSSGDAVASASKDQSDASFISTTSSIMNDREEDSNEHLDLLFPKDAREQLVQITTKPGDVVMVESSIGYHIVQVVDIMADIRKMALRKQRKVKKGTSETNPQQSASAVASPKTYQLESMGCQMNSADSERIEGQLQSLGIMPFAKDPTNSKDTSKPDVIILNTCSIRDHAEQKVYSYIGPHAKRKRDGEDVTIVVAGCVAQQEGEALLRRAPEVDLVMGPQVRKTDSGILLGMFFRRFLLVACFFAVLLTPLFLL